MDYNKDKLRKTPQYFIGYNRIIQEQINNVLLSNSEAQQHR